MSYKNRFIICIFFILTILFSTTVIAVTCEYKSSCSGDYDFIFGLNQNNNAHVYTENGPAVETSFCCKDRITVGYDGCNKDSNDLIFCLNQDNNAHASIECGGVYNEAVCIGSLHTTCSSGDSNEKKFYFNQEYNAHVYKNKHTGGESRSCGFDDTIYEWYVEPSLDTGGCLDEDEDGFYPEEEGSCTLPGGESWSAGDCDDENYFSNPGEDEICYDNYDNDCDGLTDCEDDDCSDQYCGFDGTSVNSGSICSEGNCTETSCSDGIDNDNTYKIIWEPLDGGVMGSMFTGSIIADRLIQNPQKDLQSQLIEGNENKLNEASNLIISDSTESSLVIRDASTLIIDTPALGIESSSDIIDPLALGMDLDIPEELGTVELSTPRTIISKELLTQDGADCQDQDCDLKQCDGGFCINNACVASELTFQKPITIQETTYTIQTFKNFLENLNKGQVFTSTEQSCNSLCKSKNQICGFAEAGLNTCEDTLSTRCTCY